MWSGPRPSNSRIPSPSRTRTQVQHHDVEQPPSGAPDAPRWRPSPTRTCRPPRHEPGRRSTLPTPPTRRCVDPSRMPTWIYATSRGAARDVAGSAVEHGLDLELDRDLVADDHAAGLHRGVEVHAEVGPADDAGGGEAVADPAEGVGPEAVDLEREGHALGDALEGDLAVEHVVVAVDPHAGRAVGHGGVLVGLEEVGRADVVVTVDVAGVDRRQV